MRKVATVDGQSATKTSLGRHGARLIGIRIVRFGVFGDVGRELAGFRSKA